MRSDFAIKPFTDLLRQDYLLWNRLGASLANGNKPEESLVTYREALVLCPTYTRAIYNVGVACMKHLPTGNSIGTHGLVPSSHLGLNIGSHKEAAEHLLGALSMQEATRDKSEQLLATLRRFFLAMVGLRHYSTSSDTVFMYDHP
jgi:peroxin-5